MVISDNWAELLDPGLRKIYDKHLKQYADYLAKIYNVQSSKKAAEYNLGSGELGTLDEWTATGNQVSYEDINKGYKSTYTHKKYSKGFKVERELVEDDLYNEVQKKPRKLARSVYYTRQIHAASVFNNAFNASYLGPDAKPLCSASHPTGPNNTGTTYSNVATTALDATAVETDRVNSMGWKDDKGNMLVVNLDTLIVPRNLRKAALIVADSDKEPDTSDNNVNVWKGALKVIEWPFLTDSNNWFFADGERMKEFLNWFDRRKPTLEADRANFNDESAAWKTVGRWSYGWDDWSWLIGHNVA